MSTRRGLVSLAVLLWLAAASPGAGQTAEALPALTGPVNDFAGVIDGPSAREIERLSRALQAATGDAIVVVTVETAAAHGDIQTYANQLFENQGRGIGAKGQDNGLLILLAVKDRRVWIEVGYGLEGFITDGFAGQTSREEMSPRFRTGDYGGGLLAGARRLAARIAEGRGVDIGQLPIPARTRRRPESTNDARTLTIFFVLIVLLMIANRRSRGRGRRSTYWGGGPWSGWGGGGYGGTFGGGGGFSGGGFGGFGGGRSGGGGGGSSW